jgi:hypothetical protein
MQMSYLDVLQVSLYETSFIAVASVFIDYFFRNSSFCSPFFLLIEIH